MTNDLKTYDLVVMGGGPAGAIAAAEASSFRKSVALVDKHRQIGGAGINTGTAGAASGAPRARPRRKRDASLREITGGIASTAVEASWVSTSYLIGEIITIPLTAWLGRVFGVRLYLLVNVSLFLVFSGLCGTASELTQMIFYRALQGFTGGVMIPMSFTVINTQLPPSRRPLGLVLFGITATMAPAIGPYIGGLLTDSYGWPVVFYLNFIPGAVMLATIFFAIDPEPLNMPLLWE